MFKALIYLVVNLLLVLGLATLVPNFEITNWVAGVIFVVFLAIVNNFVVPVIKLLAFPINLVTLGIFNLIVNLVAIWFSAYLVDGINIDGEIITQFFVVVLISIVLSIGQSLTHNVSDDGN